MFLLIFILYTVVLFMGKKYLKQACCLLIGIYFLSFFASGVGLSPLYCGHFWPTLPAPDDR
jgi:hypothetical protein